MKRALLAACLAAFALAGSPAQADDIQDVLISQLTEQGFTEVRISRTFLGRVRIYASSPDYTREIIFNPRTGEILRDYWNEIDGEDAGGFRGRIARPGGGAGPGPGGNGNASGDDDAADDGGIATGDGGEDE